MDTVMFWFFVFVFAGAVGIAAEVRAQCLGPGFRPLPADRTVDTALPPELAQRSPLAGAA
jgi:hypothetical protein